MVRKSLRRPASVVLATALTIGLAAELPAQATASAQVSQVQTVKVAKAQAKKKLTRKQRNKAIARGLVKKRGWSTRQYNCLVKLWTRESNWNHKARNRYSGAYGVPQALPARKMASVGRDWRTNPTTQIKWGLKYIKGRYKTPCGAWSHSRSHGWY